MQIVNTTVKKIQNHFMSVIPLDRLPVRMEYLGFYMLDFHKI
jgi:hypothetical protein